MDETSKARAGDPANRRAGVTTDQNAGSPDRPLAGSNDVPNAGSPARPLAGSNTPLMQQYHDLKSRYPDDILLFRLGDFYEMFDEDAKRAAPILEVALTHRQQIPMCGVPAHAVDPYVARLLKAGIRVAIADQMEDPAAAKGLVKRQVVRVMTPGTLQEDTLLPSKKCNFLAAVSVSEGKVGLSAIECSTGEFIATEITDPTREGLLWDELARLAPSEVVIAKEPGQDTLRERMKARGFCVSDVSPMDFVPRLAEEKLKTMLGAASVRGFGVEGKPLALGAAGAALRYFESTQCGRPCALRPLRCYSLDDFLQLDASTLTHLDLLPERSDVPKGRTLLETIDATLTPMGGRLLRRWLVAPLRNISTIHARQDRVEFFLESRDGRRHVRAALQGWPDLERILTRLSAGTIAPRDLAHLASGLRRLPKIRQLLSDMSAQSTKLGRALSETVAHFVQEFPEEAELADVLERAVVEAPPATMKDGGVIRPGYHAELDEVRSWIHDGKSRLLAMEKEEREKTGIGSLKIGFNNVFGYFIEVTKTHLSRVPMHYVRKQTMANGERYITPELKEFETKILGAEERARRLEGALVQELRDHILKRTVPLGVLSVRIAELDVLIGFADTAERKRYVRPVVDESDKLVIREGRHPVLEDVLPAGTLVPNDVALDATDRQIIILTGPNMSGKSTYLRQTALIAILAQTGSYVPAAEAHIGVLDQLFTRIGASDRLAEGESTFMVEMVETARILNHATRRSFVILDEVGRGTSTYDGISIAWACLEYLNRGPKVLFATHYFELTKLADQWAGVHNAHVTAREWGDQVVFLHKVEDGPADRAYGIHVAKLAGVPKSVVERAAILLKELEGRRQTAETAAPRQPSLFEEIPAEPEPRAKGQRNVENDRLTAWLRELSQMNLDQTTPLQALLKLQEWKKQIDPGN